MIQREFVDMLKEAIGEDRALVALNALDCAPSVSVRLNPYKPLFFGQCRGASGQCRDVSGSDEVLENQVFEGQCESVPWSPYSRLLSSRPVFTLDPSFHAGAYYVQDSSAMFVGEMFRRVLPKGISRPLRVLDLCAAPGGKTTDLAASLREKYGDGFFLVANEVMKARAQVLRDNLAHWGDPNVVVTSVDPKAFAALKGFFDIILADVPCSGEGMFRKDAQAQSQWSVDNVHLCEGRSRRIIADVWPALARGGALIYSTCTFNAYENDGNVAWIAAELGGEVMNAFSEGAEAPYEGVLRTKYGYSLVPGFVRGEGQYCAALRKTGGEESHCPKTSSKKKPVRGDVEALFGMPMAFLERGGMLIAIPAALCAEFAALEPLHPLMCGCAVGEFKGQALVPNADLALCIALKDDAFVKVDVDRQTALRYLHKDAVLLPGAPKGLLLVCYLGLPLGFVKNLGSRCNSLLPSDRRIRMEIC